MSIYLKYPEIHGEVTTEGYKNWIELNSFQYGVSRNVSSGAGGNTRESSAPNIGEIVVTKHFDKSSAKLYQDLVAGTFDTKVVIKMTTTTKNKTETFLTFELSDCGVSSYSLSSGGDTSDGESVAQLPQDHGHAHAARQVGPDQEGRRRLLRFAGDEGELTHQPATSAN